MVQVDGVERGDEAATLIAAAQALLRESGLSGVTIAAVLERTELGTRAFYRHFSSKDHLLVEVFADATLTEVDRLALLIARTSTPQGGVTAWIDGRLDLGFDTDVESDLRFLSQQAQVLYAAAPETMSELYQVMMLPLVEQIQAGIGDGVFVGVEPWLAAQSVASVVWSRVEQEWLSPSEDATEVRAETLAFCLRGLGVSPGRRDGAGAPVRSAATGHERA